MVKASLRPLVAQALVLAVAASCTPDLEDNAAIVNAPRVLAVRSEPAEAAPKGNPPTTITWSALFVDGHGDADPNLLDWAECIERKPLVTAGEISLDCLTPQNPEVLVPVGNGNDAMGTLPDDACRLFGPNPPIPKAGEPAPRPTDPDSTGGFYQPLRLRAAVPGGDQYTVGVTRLTCGLARVNVEQSQDFQNRYRTNANPEIARVVVAGSDQALTGDPATTVSVKPGSKVTFRVEWPDCPTASECGDGICGANEDKMNCPDDCTEPHGCTGSEPYVSFDLASRQILDRREGMRVSWYNNVGTFEHDRTGRPEEEAATPNISNDWTAPSSPMNALIWVVLRDDRGGVAYESLVVHVE